MPESPGDLAALLQTYGRDGYDPVEVQRLWICIACQRADLVPVSVRYPLHTCGCQMAWTSTTNVVAQ